MIALTALPVAVLDATLEVAVAAVAEGALVVLDVALLFVVLLAAAGTVMVETACGGADELVGVVTEETVGAAALLTAAVKCARLGETEQPANSMAKPQQAPKRGVLNLMPMSPR